MPIQKYRHKRAMDLGLAMNLLWTYWIGVASDLKLALYFLALLLIAAIMGMFKDRTQKWWRHALIAGVVLFFVASVIPGSEASAALYLTSHYRSPGLGILESHPTAPLVNIATVQLAIAQRNAEWTDQTARNSEGAMQAQARLDALIKGCADRPGCDPFELIDPYAHEQGEVASKACASNPKCDPFANPLPTTSTAQSH